MLLFPGILTANTEPSNCNLLIGNLPSLNNTTPNLETNSPNEDAVKINWKRLRRDLTGAVSGAGVGAAIGGGVGAAIGAVVGGVIGSGGESPLVGPTNPPISTTLDDVKNAANPYDNIGLTHYQGMDDIFSNPSGIISQEGVVNTTNYYSWASNFIVNKNLGTAIQVSNYYPYNKLVEGYNHVNATPDFSAFMGELQVEGTISSTEANILLPYFSTLENSIDLDSFVSYSIAQEGSVLNSNTLSENSKAILLTFMATARYGAAYWQIF